MTDTLKKLIIVIIVLSVLLALSLAALAGVIIYGKNNLSDGSAVVRDNYIESASNCASDMQSNIIKLRAAPIMMRASVPGSVCFGKIPTMAFSKTIVASDSAKDTVISIYKNHAEDSEPFRTTNMFPGDSVTRKFFVEVSHKGTVTVCFRSNIRPGYEKLSEVLKCKVVLNNENKTLYDGPMRDMPESIDHRISSVSGTTTELIYYITVYLDTSVGNEYMNKELVADFRWWVEEKNDDSTSSSKPDGPSSKPDEPSSKPDEPSSKPDEPSSKPNEPSSKPDEPSFESDEPLYPERDDGELIPNTGGDFNLFVLSGVAAISLFISIILLWPKRRKHDKKEGFANG